MAGLSISRAWDEARHIIKHDGRLIASVALALVALPTAILGVLSPGGLVAAMLAAMESSSAGSIVLFVAVLLLMIVGQLAVTRLAIGPSVSVGGAIGHAARRLPAYVAAGLIVGALIMLVAIVMGVVVAFVLGEPAASSMSQEELAKSPLVALMMVLLIALYLSLFARIISMAAAVTSTEQVGPIGIIRRSWSITSGHFWRILAFLLVFLISSGIVLLAIGSAVGVIARLALGKIEPMSASAVVMALIDAVASSAVTVLLVVMLARIYVQLAGSDAAQASVPSSGT